MGKRGLVKGDKSDFCMSFIWSFLSGKVEGRKERGTYSMDDTKSNGSITDDKMQNNLNSYAHFLIN